jgi:hypothetical protein
METKFIELTPELKDKLNGSLGFQVETPFPFTPPVFRAALPKEQWPVFILRSKNGLEIAKVEDEIGVYQYNEKSAGGDVKMFMHSGTVRIETLSIGIMKILRYPTEDGALMYYDTKSKLLTIGDRVINGASINKVLEYLPARVQISLQNAINERSVMSAEDLQGLAF